MQIDILVAEIGSTTTLVNAFGNMDSSPTLLGSGSAPTTVYDVNVGLSAAVDNLQFPTTPDIPMLATSSAAGGLRMTIHGLVYDMTVKAGQEAALGAGANIHLATAGKLTQQDLLEISNVSPNLMLLAGGTDYGDRETVLYNAEMLCNSAITAPVIYCGNIQNQTAIRDMFAKANKRLYITENVYPRLDELNIEPVRGLIHRAFEEHITEAKGMAHIRDTVSGAIMPTPGAVMAAAQLLYEKLGDLMVVDVGGATTDIHSVTDGTEEIAALQISPEPRAKRTVEGDLGVYVNARSLADIVGLDKLSSEIGMDVLPIFDNYKPIPQSAEQLALTTRLAYHASRLAIMRHAGTLRYTYGLAGRKTHAMGKDLTAIRHIIATGGALTRLPQRQEILVSLTTLNASGAMLYPKPNKMAVLEDVRYIMASIGVLAQDYPEAARVLAKKYIVAV
ncbi:MAG: glutamate mutase L [Defluviitaleaceae bacterium]|nr:glutamate mutase L [Defluviitaleaceae bacterium]